MPNTITVLFTSAGRRNQLIGCFRADAAQLGLPIRILAADLHPDLSPACHHADTSFTVPRCTSPEYVSELKRICQQESVQLIVPTIDTELPVLSASQAEFAAMGTRVLVSSPAVVALVGHKLNTSRCLADHGITTPRTTTLAEYLNNPNSLRWPVIAKPVSGSASSGIVRPRKPEELKEIPVEGYIVQELWQGREYTVNIFCDQEGRLRCAVPHLRMEVRAGEVSKGRTERIPQLEDAAQLLASALPGAIGPLCFQAIVTEADAYAVFEINARFGGGYPLAHQAGARMSQWILEEIAGLPSSANNSWMAGTTMLRYDEAVFLNA